MGFKPTTLCLPCTHSKNTSSFKDVFFLELLKVNLVCCNSYNIKLPWHNATDFSFIESFYLFIVTLAILSILTFQLTSSSCISDCLKIVFDSLCDSSVILLFSCDPWQRMFHFVCCFMLLCHSCEALL